MNLFLLFSLRLEKYIFWAVKLRKNLEDSVFFRGVVVEFSNLKYQKAHSEVLNGQSDSK
jgi:hypothetical protein